MMSKYFVPLLLLVFSLGTACTSQDEISSSSDQTSSVGIPEPIRIAGLLPSGDLAVKIFVDASASPSVYKNNLDVTAATFEFSFQVPPGDHDISIVFEYTSPSYGGPFELAHAKETINISVGQTYRLEFGPYFYPDDDNDGITNLTELDDTMNTDPADATCKFGQSYMGEPGQKGCTFGS